MEKMILGHMDELDDQSDTERELFDKGSENKKTIYIFRSQKDPNFLYAPNLPYTLTTADLYKNPHLLKESKIITKNIPPDFANLRGYNVATVDSKIYFMGGYVSSVFNPCNSIFIFDIDSNSWDDPQFMNQKRAHPNLLPYQGKIYVFGSWSEYDELPDDCRLDNFTFAEYFDPKSSRSYYLSGCPPLDITIPGLHLISAVDNTTQSVLFCLPSFAIVGYSFQNENWFEVTIPEHLSLCHPIYNWSYSVLVIKNILIWSFFGIIYGYDLSLGFLDPAPVPMSAVPKNVKDFGNPNEHMGLGCPPPSYLIDLGNMTFCLVNDTKKSCMQFHQFKVCYSRSLNKLTVKYQSSETHPSKGASIAAISEVSKKCIVKSRFGSPSVRRNDIWIGGTETRTY